MSNTSNHDALVDAVVAAINSAPGFAWPVQAVAAMLPETARTELAEGLAHVAVVPSSRLKARASRGEKLKAYSVDVGLLVPVGPALADRDANALLTEIEDYLEDLDLAFCTSAVWIESATIPGAEAGYFPEHLRKLNQLTAAVRVTYRWIE
jgi:hypothetical protein